jgi:hypothetical protein
MPIRCVVCCHSQQETIDARLRAGEPLWPLVRDYALRSGELRHHRDEHVHKRERTEERRGQSA